MTIPEGEVAVLLLFSTNIGTPSYKKEEEIVPPQKFKLFYWSNISGGALHNVDIRDKKNLFLSVLHCV